MASPQPPKPRHPYLRMHQIRSGQTGQIVCYENRTYRVLPTIPSKTVDRATLGARNFIMRPGGELMTTATQTLAGSNLRRDFLLGKRVGLIDRWIYVFTAAVFVMVVLAGFIPDSFAKVAAVQAGERPPFPLVLHIHALLMGSYLLVLLSQTVLVATGRVGQHRRLGIAGMVLAPALVVVGFILVPTMYHLAFAAAEAAPAALKSKMDAGLARAENTLLLQTRIGLMFAILLILGLRARATDPGFHKRMMILSIAVALPAGFDRIAWIPTTLPERPISPDLYVLLAIAPMFLWDVFRNRTIHRAYWVWLAVALPFTLAVHALWDTPFWHSAAKIIIGV